MFELKKYPTQYDDLRDIYTCPSCSTLNDTAVALPCQHEVHEKCALKIIQEFGSQCPICVSPFAEYKAALSTRAAVQALLPDTNTIEVRVKTLAEEVFLIPISPVAKVAKLFREIQSKEFDVSKACLTVGAFKMENFESISEYLDKDQKVLDVFFHATGLTPELEIKAKEAKLLKKRSLYQSQLPNFVKVLLTFGTKFDANYQAMLSSSLSILIGLSQHVDFNIKVQHQILGLNELLGKSPFQYVHDNIYPDTTKPRKAATLFIIKGLCHADGKIRQEAVNTFEKLVQDYRLAGHACPQKLDYERAVFAVCRAFWDSKPNKQLAAKELAALWKNDVDALKLMCANQKEIDLNAILEVLKS